MHSDNFFTLFDIPVSFDVDRDKLANHYRDLQQTVHPDKYATASSQERRLSLQNAATINEAYHVLKNPLQRARYLLELHGVPLNDETDTSMDAEFLMEQMTFRETLAEIPDAGDPVNALVNLVNDIDQREKEIIADLRIQFQIRTQESLQIARESVKKLQFIKRLQEEAADLEEELI